MTRETHGALAAPFLRYLLRRYGTTTASELYQIDEELLSEVLGPANANGRQSNEDASELRGTGLLDVVIRRNSQDNNQASLQSEFVAYCTEAGLLGVTDSELDEAIADTVGPRIRTDVFSKFPVNRIDRNATIDHLGCRYFEIVLPPNRSKLIVSLNPVDREQLSSLNATLTTISDQAEAQDVIHFNRSERPRQLICEVPVTGTERVLLTVVNVAHGSGWSLQDGLAFEVQGDVR